MLDRPDANACGQPDRRRREPSDFELTYADGTWRWADEARPGLPILHYPDGSVCEPVLAYFGYSAETARVVISSMKVEAYAIREFLCFLWNEGLTWDQPDDRTLRRWRQQQKDLAAAAEEQNLARNGTAHLRRRKRRKVSPRQIERKIAFVLEFYRLVPEALCLGADGKPWPAFVGPARSRKRFAITTKTLSIMTPRGPQTVTRWIGAARLPSGTVLRAAPSEEAVVRVLARLRGAALVDPTRRPTASAAQQSFQEAERSWLMARCQAEAGLRAEEVVELTVRALARALAEDGVGGALLGSRGSLEDWLGGEPSEEVRDRVVADLEELVFAGRTGIGVRVTCKGRTRVAPFPIPLLSDLIQTGLWLVRSAQVRNWTARRAGYVAPPQVFLSFKTGRGLSAGALGDLVKAAFRAEGVAGSGHRLRAFFGTELAHRLLPVRLALNGLRYDLSVERWVLQHVAEAMGHAHWSTTVASYVDRALMRLVGAPSPTALSRMIHVHRALLANASSMTDDDFTGILRGVLAPGCADVGVAPSTRGGAAAARLGEGRSGEVANRPARRRSGRPRADEVRRQAFRLLNRRRLVRSSEGMSERGNRSI